MIATIEDLSAAPKQPVHELADPRPDALHPARDRGVVVRFDQQMQVIALNRVVHDPEAVPNAGLAQARAEPTHEPRLTQRR